MNEWNPEGKALKLSIVHTLAFQSPIRTAIYTSCRSGGRGVPEYPQKINILLRAN